MRLRVVTYNIHECVGLDGDMSPSRIASVLSHINPDVAALQEVSFEAAAPGNVLERLAGAVGARAIPGPTLLRNQAHYGNAALTRIAPERIRRMDISMPGREPRGALAVDLRFRGRGVRVVTTHLGLRPGERRRQMRHVLAMLGRVRPGVTTILLGDFNEWFSWGRPLRWAARHFGRPPAPPTFPSGRPLLALDRIWVHPPERLASLRPHRARPANVASDHLPLVAEVEF